MKKLLLTLIAILMVASVFANNYVISEEEKDVDINKVVVPESYNYFDDLGCSKEKSKADEPGDEYWKLMGRLWEYNHAYDTGVDNLNLYVYNCSILNISKLTSPTIFKTGKVPGYVTDIFYCYGISNIKEKIYSGYGMYYDFRMYTYFLNDNSYYAPEAYSNYKDIKSIIVGWDDNYSKDNFKIAPSGDGAFLVQTLNGDLYWLSYYNSTYWSCTGTRYYDKSLKPYTSYIANTVLCDDDRDQIQHYYEDIQKKYGKVNFNCEKNGILYAFRSDYYRTTYHTSSDPGKVYKCNYFKSYKIYLNDELKEEKTINTLQGYIDNIELDNPISYKKGDVLSVELENNKDEFQYYNPWVQSKEEDKIKYGGKRENSFFRASETDEWESVTENIGSKYEPNYYYAQIPLSLLVDETVKAENLEFLQDEVSLGVNGKGQLEWRFTPSDTTNQDVELSSSDPSVVMVNNLGAIRGLKKGTATITIKSVDGGLTDTCKVNVDSEIIRVTGVELAEEELTLKYGETYKLAASVLPENATNKKVTWKTDNPNVAAVDQYGYVSAFGKGEATITVETAEGSYTDTCKVTVTNIPVTGIELDKYTATVEVGKTIVINKTILPENASDKSVTWDSLNPEVATVDQTGLVTGVNGGEATIKVTSNDNNKVYAECVVTVTGEVKPTSIKLNKETLSLKPTKKFKLVATVLPENAEDKTVTWQSSNPSVVKVTNAGIVEGVSGGVANIVATTCNGISAYCKVSVPPTLITKIELDKTSFSLFKDCSYTLKATITPANATYKTLKWTSSNPNVATVSANGEVTGVALGTAKITAKATDGSGKYATCSVKVIIPVSNITLNKTSLKLNKDKSFKIIATVAPANASNKKIKWTSTDTDVATVTSTGIVKAVGSGICSIIAEATDGSGIKAECKITVPGNVPIKTITLNKTTLTLKPSKTYKLIATITPSYATNKKLLWTSLDTSVATVSTTGIVTAKKAGTTKIFAIALDGSSVSASCDVKVVN